MCTCRSTLYSLATYERKRSVELATLSTSSVNYRYLTIPEKRTHLLDMKKENRALNMCVKRLELKLSEVIENKGVILDEETSADFYTVMEEHDTRIQLEHEEDTFQYVFGEQQKKAIGREEVKRKGIRWHPLIIKWCLYLLHQSSKAYDTLRESGCLLLPSQHTLRDYSHAVEMGAGFSSEVDNQLFQIAKLLSSPPYHALIAILIDEISVKEDLVYNKHIGKVVGFVNLGEINNHLMKFEQSLNDEKKRMKLC